MSSGLIVALELGLTLVVVIGLAVWDLLRLQRGRRHDRAREESPVAPPASAGADEASIGREVS
jgi:hypothetical protein